MKSFSTAGKHTSDDGFEGAEPIQFELDGVTYTAYPPTGAQFALFMASQASHASQADGIAAIIDFFDGMLEPETQRIYRERLVDRDDPFDFDTVQEILEFLIEEWSANPTKSPQDSPQSPPKTGPRSTAKRRSTA